MDITDITALEEGQRKIFHKMSRMFFKVIDKMLGYIS